MFSKSLSLLSKQKGLLLLGLRWFYERFYGLINNTLLLQCLTLYYTNLCAYASCRLGFGSLLYGAFLLTEATFICPLSLLSTLMEFTCACYY